MTTTKTRSHEHEFTINAPPEAVWKAFTSAEELVRWFPLDASVEPGVGGHIVLGWGEFRGHNCIEVWEPGRHLRMTWMEPMLSSAEASALTPDEEGRRQLAVDWFIEGAGGKTVLRLVHSGFSRDSKWDGEYDGTRRGWGFELRSLQHYLERHRGTDRIAFWVRRPVEGDARQAWSRMTGADGFFKECSIDSLGAGDTYALTLGSGDRLEGKVMINTPPTDFAGTAENLNGGLFRFGYEDCLGRPEAHMWLSTWGLPKSEIDALQSRYDALATKVFPQR